MAMKTKVTLKGQNEIPKQETVCPVILKEDTNVTRLSF